VAATAESEHSRLAASECALREQNAAQLKRIAVLEERVEAAQRLQADHEHALAALSETQTQLQKASDEKAWATRDLHSRVEKCKSLERQLSKAKEASAEDEKAVFAARAAAARALDEAAACRLKCNELDGASWCHKDKLLKTQEVLLPLRKRADAAEHLVEKYERQLEEAEQKERLSFTRASRLEKENKDLKMEVQSLAAEKQVLRLELLQANLENDKVTRRSINNAVPLQLCN
jgi:chromosome segregation ATPase